MKIGLLQSGFEIHIAPASKKWALGDTAMRLYGANGYMVTNSTGTFGAGGTFSYIWISAKCCPDYITCDLPTGELNP